MEAEEKRFKLKLFVIDSFVAPVQGFLQTIATIPDNFFICYKAVCLLLNHKQWAVYGKRDNIC